MRKKYKIKNLEEFIDERTMQEIAEIQQLILERVRSINKAGTKKIMQGYDFDKETQKHRQMTQQIPDQTKAELKKLVYGLSRGDLFKLQMHLMQVYGEMTEAATPK